MKKNAGFTLIELMIVVAIIAIIAAIAIPNLLRSRMQSNESAAIGNMRTICGAEVAYHSANYRYADTFASMTTPASGPPFLDGTWDGVTKSGYVYTLGAGAGVAGSTFAANGNAETFGVTGNKGFFVDGSGIIRYTVGGASDANGTPIGQAG